MYDNVQYTVLKIHAGTVNGFGIFYILSLLKAITTLFVVDESLFCKALKITLHLKSPLNSCHYFVLKSYILFKIRTITFSCMEERVGG